MIKRDIAKIYNEELLIKTIGRKLVRGKMVKDFKMFRKIYYLVPEREREEYLRTLREHRYFVHKNIHIMKGISNIFGTDVNLEKLEEGAYLDIAKRDMEFRKETIIFLLHIHSIYKHLLWRRRFLGCTLLEDDSTFREDLEGKVKKK